MAHETAEERRNTGMGSTDLKGWFAQLAAPPAGSQ
jgi:hypothetical protein